MRSPFNVFGHEIFSTFSIGIVHNSTGDYVRHDDLIRDADTAMYYAKARGKACHVIFESTMRAEAETALWLETDLRKALANREFIVWYQPIISMQNNKIIGFEALLRWQHPERGLLYPMDFMSVAEDTGLIIPIGEWILYEACRQLRLWQEQFPGYGDLTVSVNVSSKIFSQTDFYEVIEKILSETGLPARSLRLEIVERMLIENPEPAAALLKRLSDLDIQIDIDDFGTGYSALNYLRHFPINGLKIDRSFINAIVTDKHNAAIVKTIIMLAQILDLDVIAEGIETVEQLETFRTMDGGYAQGYYLFRPQGINEIERILVAE
jgi:EAL domain-containing protein (putative c-di-GMP-specific phosphodiesterase class I)